MVDESEIGICSAFATSGFVDGGEIIQALEPWRGLAFQKAQHFLQAIFPDIESEHVRSVRGLRDGFTETFFKAQGEILVSFANSILLGEGAHMRSERVPGKSGGSAELPRITVPSMPGPRGSRDFVRPSTNMGF